MPEPAQLAKVARFDPEGRRDRRVARRQRDGYAQAAADPAPVVPLRTARIGGVDTGWRPVEDWVRSQANPRLRGLPTEAQWHEAARGLEVVGVWMHDTAEQLLSQLRQAGKGYPTSSRGQEGGRGGAPGIPTTGVERAVLGHVADPVDGSDDHDSDRYLARPDVDDQLVPVAQALLKAAGLIVSCQRRLGSGLADRNPERHEDAGLPAGAGRCSACDDFVTGGRTNSIVSGLCPRCKTSWVGWQARHKGATRPEWVAARRVRLAEQAAAAHGQQPAEDEWGDGKRFLAAEQDRHGRGPRRRAA